RCSGAGRRRGGDPARGARAASGLAAHPAERVHLRGRLRRRGVRPPSRDRDHAGFHQFQALEEAGDLLRGAEHVGERAALVVTLLRLLRGRAGDGPGATHQGQVTAGRKRPMRWRTIARAASPSVRWPSTPFSISATGLVKSSVLAASAKIVPGSRMSASMYAVTPCGVLVSSARAWA